MTQGIIRFPRVLPKTLREWERIFDPINQVITETPEGVSIESESIPSTEAPYITTAPVADLTAAKQLTDATGQTVVAVNGLTVSVELADAGTPGTYPKVVTDSKGRVVAGGALLTTDMPAALQRIYSGVGTPNGVVSAPPGSLYLNGGGGAGTTLYVKETGSSNTGWVAR